jgi:hypothetical protein
LDLDPAWKSNTSFFSDIPEVKRYRTVLPVTEVKTRRMMGPLKCIPPVRHDFFINLQKTNVGSQEYGSFDYHEPDEDD